MPLSNIKLSENSKDSQSNTLLILTKEHTVTSKQYRGPAPLENSLKL